MNAGMLVRTSESPPDVPCVRAVWPRAGAGEGFAAERSGLVARALPVAGAERLAAAVPARWPDDGPGCAGGLTRPLPCDGAERAA